MSEAVTETPDQAITRLAALSPVEYSQQRRGTAKTLGIQVSVLDAEVAAVRDQADQEHSPDPLRNRYSSFFSAN